MDLFFCDICNESVPQVDLEGGQARQLGQRVICASCELAMSPPDSSAASLDSAATPGGIAGVEGVGPQRVQVTAPSEYGDPNPNSPEALSSSHASVLGLSNLASRPMPSPAKSRGGSLFLIALIAVSALAASTFVIVEYGQRIQAARIAGQQDAIALELRLAQTEIGLRDDFERRLVEQGSNFFAQLDEERATQQAWRTEINGRLDELRAQLGQLGLVANRLTKLETDARLGLTRSTALSLELADLTREVNLLIERWTEAVATGDVARSDSAQNGENALPAWRAYVENLSSPSADTRWTAVNALGESHDEAVIPHLIKMLDDHDIFVRVATARIFGDLGSMLAVEALIDALDDDTQSVREVVVDSLRRITAQNFRFDPGAREADRVRRIKAWRDWWNKQA